MADPQAFTQASQQASQQPKPSKRGVFVQIFMSNRAWDALLEQARHADYIRGFIRTKGIGLYMHDLVANNLFTNEWEDTRSHSMQLSALDDLEAGRFSEWDDGSPKFVRQVVLPNITPQLSTVAASAALAWQLGVVKVTAGGSGRRQQPALASQFWEAVGLGWLTPTNKPHSHYATDPKPTKTELDF